MKRNQKPTILNYVLPVIMIAIGLLHLARHGMDLAGLIPIVLGIFALYMALFNHPLLQRVLNIITKLWYPIGQGITVVLLTITFFLVFAPVGLLLRLLKKDILNKNINNDRASYWLDRADKPKNSYTQQF